MFYLLAMQLDKTIKPIKEKWPKKIAQGNGIHSPILLKKGLSQAAPLTVTNFLLYFPFFWIQCTYFWQDCIMHSLPSGNDEDDRWLGSGKRGCKSQLEADLLKGRLCSSYSNAFLLIIPASNQFPIPRTRYLAHSWL